MDIQAKYYQLTNTRQHEDMQINLSHLLNRIEMLEEYVRKERPDEYLEAIKSINMKLDGMKKDIDFLATSFS